LLALFVLALGIRSVNLNASFWEDELITRMRVERGVEWTWQSCSASAFYVFPQMMLHLGRSEALLRLPGILFGALGVLVVYGLAAEVGGAAAGLVAALLLATAPFHVRYSQEFRMYSAMMLASSLLVWLLYRFTRRGNPLDAAGACAATIWGMLLHGFLLPFAGVVYGSALIWLMGTRGIASRRARLARILVVLIGLGTAGLGYVKVASVSGFELSSFLVRGDDSGPDEAFRPSDDDNVYRLTARNYLIDFPKKFFPLGSTSARALLVLTGLWGLGTLLRRDRPMALMFFSAMFLLPIPFFFVDMSHFYAARHMAFVVPLSVVCIAVGMCSLGQRLRTSIEHRASGGGSVAWLGPLAHAFTVMALLASLALPTARGLSEYYKHRPYRDWKGLTDYVGRTMQAHDPVFFVGDAGNARRLRIPFNLSLGSGQANGPALVNAYSPQSGALTRDTVGALANAFPESNLWFILEPTQNAAAENILGPLGGTMRTFAATPMIWVVGEPTANLMSNGGSEVGELNRRLMEGRSAPGLAIGKPAEAYEGNGCLRLALSDPDQDVSLWLPIKSDTPWIRNRGFEVWKDNVPVGWRLSSGDEVVYPGGDAFNGRYALAFAPKDGGGAVHQRIPLGSLPGHTVEVQAQAKADGEATLCLSLVYDVPGETVRITTEHAGPSEWTKLTARAKIPLEADAESIAIEIARVGPGEGIALVDEVRVRAWDLPSLDPHQAYTVSMMLKYEHVIEEGFIQTTGYSIDTDRTQVHTLHTFHGSRDWHFLAFPVIPGLHTPPGYVTHFTVIFGLNGHPTGRARLWIDNVQVEANDHPTPFVHGRRLPHDEQFDRMSAQILP